MAALVAAIYALLGTLAKKKGMDARHKSLSLGRPKAGPEGRA
jgi:hypothetical protein